MPPSSGGFFDYPVKKDRLEEVSRLSEAPDFWNDAARAQELGRERKALEDVVLVLDRVASGLKDAAELFEMAREENDDDTLAAVQADIAGIEKDVSTLEFRRMFNNPADPSNCFLDIQAGAGGTEACDWASMLLRQYLKYAERKGFKAELLEESEGDVAGIKSASIKIEGDYAYGYLRTETGVHRLVRKSPFDNQGRRHTSFSSVHPLPELDDAIEVDINEDDLRIDTYRSGGAGGQHINKTDSAVRITHIPTGIVVACQNERSQHKNKAFAMKVLRARLYELERQKQEEHLASIGPEQRENAFGSQIRSYVLHPYRLVKDLRTGVEFGNADAVLDGDIDDFIRAYLMQASGGAAAA